MQDRQPIDKGRVCVIAEKYQSQQQDPQTGQQLTKNRYATVGRATLWPQEQGQNMPNIQIEIDTMPISAQGPVKMFVFWNSESQQNQKTQQGGHQQQSAQQHPPQQQQQQQQGGYGGQRG